MFSVALLTAICAEHHKQVLFTKCRNVDDSYAECCNDKCCYTEMLSVDMLSLVWRVYTALCAEHCEEVLFTKAVVLLF